jgi:hypothetical protein
MAMRSQDRYPQPSSRYSRFPTTAATESDIIGFRDTLFAEFQAFRNTILSNIARNILYKCGQQWIERDDQVMTDGARGFAWRAMQPNADVERPMPVDNRITSSIDTEFATLSKRQWQPKIPTYSRDPRREASAKVASEILKDRLRKLHWDDLRDRFILNDITHGTAILKSFWNESYYETTWIQSPDAMQCQSCERTLSTPRVPSGLVQMLQQGRVVSAEEMQGPEDAELANCPICTGPLSPANLTEQSSRGMDMFNRPLGSEVPKGNTDLEIISAFEYYPQNSGIYFTPETIKQHGICKVRTLDWIEEHYPWLEGKVDPEPPEELLRYHPTLGQWDYLGRFHPGWDSGMFDCHARVFEMYAEPSFRYPEGRQIVVVGRRQDLIAINEPLVKSITDERTGEKVTVPKVSIAISVWKSIDDVLWGRGLPDDIISPQNRMNGIDSQTIEARERMGSPNLIIPEDADLQGPEFDSSYGVGKLFHYQLSALAPNAKPEVFGSILMPEGVNVERQTAEDSIKKIIGPADIEIGEAPRNVTTTSGLQILGEQAERRRGTRERSITSAFQKIWEHQLQMLWVLRIDEDYYEDRTPDGSWELKQYNRESIAGHTRVEIEKQAYIDRSIVLREASREAQVDGLYGPPDQFSPLVRKKLLEIRGLPSDVNEETNLQIDHAKRAWVDFVDDQKVPVIDPSIDNPTIYFQVLGAQLKQDEGMEISKNSGWHAIVGDLAGWEDEYQQISMKDAEMRAMYPSEEGAPQAFAELTMAYQAAKGAYDQQIQAAQLAPPMPGMPPTGPMGPPPQPPPTPVFIPRQVEKRILLVWGSMLGRTDTLANWTMEESRKTLVPEDEIKARTETYLRMRAYIEGFRILGGGVGPAPGSLPQGVMPQPPATAPPAQPGAAPAGPAPTEGTPPLPATPPQ